MEQKERVLSDQGRRSKTNSHGPIMRQQAALGSSNMGGEGGEMIGTDNPYERTFQNEWGDQNTNCSPKIRRTGGRLQNLMLKQPRFMSNILGEKCP